MPTTKNNKNSLAHFQSKTKATVSCCCVSLCKLHYSQLNTKLLLYIDSIFQVPPIKLGKISLYFSPYEYFMYIDHTFYLQGKTKNGYFEIVKY